MRFSRDWWFVPRPEVRPEHIDYCSLEQAAGLSFGLVERHWICLALRAWVHHCYFEFSSPHLKDAKRW